MGAAILAHAAGGQTRTAHPATPIMVEKSSPNLILTQDHAPSKLQKHIVSPTLSATPTLQAPTPYTGPNLSCSTTHSHTELPEVPSEPTTEIGRSRFWSALSAPGECCQRGSGLGRGDHSHKLASFEHPRRRARQLQQVSHDGQAGRMNRSWFSRFEHVQRLLRSKLSTERPLCTSLVQEVAATRISRRPARCVQDSARRRPMTQLIWTLERFLSMEAIEMVHAGAERPAEKAIDDVRRAAEPRPSPWRGAKFGL